MRETGCPGADSKEEQRKMVGYFISFVVLVIVGMATISWLKDEGILRWGDPR